MGLPPGELREMSMNAIGTPDIFGTGLRLGQMQQMKILEEEAVSHFFVIISDIQLDRPQVLSFYFSFQFLVKVNFNDFFNWNKSWILIYNCDVCFLCNRSPKN